AGVIHRLGLLQLDFVNVLLPAHYLVLYSRLGMYDKGLFHDLVYRRREFTEQWAHEASIVPMSSWPLLGHRRETHRVRPYGFEQFLHSYPHYVARVLDQVRLRGPLTAEDIPETEGVPRKIPGGWHSSVARAVLEAHFGQGRLAVADRRPNFARAYDLAERIVPPHHYQRRAETHAAQRELLEKAALACGIATAADLADYYRMPAGAARPRISELVSAGVLLATAVEGWKETAYMHRDAMLPAGAGCASILSPFDPLVWYRPRLQRLFAFDYRIEIFVPAARRRWGYYVLPFLLGERMAARVDLKADRAASTLQVLSSHLEPGIDPGETARSLSAELQTLAMWLGLVSVRVHGRGIPARALAAALR
ncbi:MAG: YcaQ family DNA glycosylase, partial [Bryobacterales bacterium]|nr:YcaQ family DNA glycosylase [Bryobacterales bacterium]